MMSRRSSIQQCSSQGEAHGRRHARRLQAITPEDGQAARAPTERTVESFATPRLDAIFAAVDGRVGSVDGRVGSVGCTQAQPRTQVKQTLKWNKKCLANNAPCIYGAIRRLSSRQEG